MAACRRRNHQSLLALLALLVKFATVVFPSVAVVSCSPAPLSEEELLQVLVKVNHVGPLNFRRDVWPSLENKTITYCGQLAEVKPAGTGTLLLMKVDKPSGGEKLPWSLEGKSASPDVARSYKPGEPLCMTGTIEGFSQVQENVYWGYVKILSMSKPTTS
jgi:hypothetical protein